MTISSLLGKLAGGDKPSPAVWLATMPSALFQQQDAIQYLAGIHRVIQEDDKTYPPCTSETLNSSDLPYPCRRRRSPAMIVDGGDFGVMPQYLSA